MKEHYLSKVVAHIPSSNLERVMDEQTLSKISDLYWSMLFANYDAFGRMMISSHITDASQLQYLNILAKRWTAAYNKFMHALYKETYSNETIHTKRRD